MEPKHASSRRTLIGVIGDGSLSPERDDDKIWRADSAPKVVSLLRTQLPRYRRG